MTLSLHSLAAAVVRDSNSPDPDDMVAAFVAQLDPNDYRDVITSLARDLIRATIRHQREPLSPVAASGSKKIAAAREAWRRLLDVPEYVPSSGWVFLRDASRQQVLEMAELRETKARELSAAAQQYVRLAEAMTATGAVTVSDLPDDTLAALLAPTSKPVAA